MKNSKALEFASEELQDDPELIFKVFEDEDKSSALRTMEITRIASLVSTLKLKNLSSRQNIINTLNNKDKFVEWVSRYGKILKYASRELKKDRELVLAAVQQDDDALQFASEELRNDPEIKLTAFLSLYRKAEKDKKKQELKTDIIRLVTETLATRDEDEKPVNLTTFIDFEKFLEIRRDPDIISATIRNYPQEDLNLALANTIFGVGGDHSAAEVFQQIEEKDLLGKLNADESVKWQNFKGLLHPKFVLIFC